MFILQLFVYARLNFVKDKRYKGLKTSKFTFLLLQQVFWNGWYSVKWELALNLNLLHL
jgi:hypothetical protein